MTPVNDTVPLALKVSANEFPVVLSEAVHVPRISPAVPLDLVQVSPPSAVMVADVIVTPVLVVVLPADTPSHTKFELVQLTVCTPVAEFHV
jgi:hypothetical protein